MPTTEAQTVTLEEAIGQEVVAWLRIKGLSRICLEQEEAAATEKFREAAKVLSAKRLAIFRKWARAEARDIATDPHFPREEINAFAFWHWIVRCWLIRYGRDVMFVTPRAADTELTNHQS